MRRASTGAGAIQTALQTPDTKKQDGGGIIYEAS